jgi:hypothetical protein
MLISFGKNWMRFLNDEGNILAYINMANISHITVELVASSNKEYKSKILLYKTANVNYGISHFSGKDDEVQLEIDEGPEGIVILVSAPNEAIHSYFIARLQSISE